MSNRGEADDNDQTYYNGDDEAYPFGDDDEAYRGGDVDHGGEQGGDLDSLDVALGEVPVQLQQHPQTSCSLKIL